MCSLIALFDTRLRRMKHQIVTCIYVIACCFHLHKNTAICDWRLYICKLLVPSQSAIWVIFSTSWVHGDPAAFIPRDTAMHGSPLYYVLAVADHAIHYLAILNWWTSHYAQNATMAQNSHRITYYIPFILTHTLKIKIRTNATGTVKSLTTVILNSCLTNSIMLCFDNKLLWQWNNVWILNNWTC